MHQVTSQRLDLCAGLKLGDPGTRAFKYVRIPADYSVPYEQLTTVVLAEDDGSARRTDQLPTS